jgi:hypothetical protein
LVPGALLGLALASTGEAGGKLSNAALIARLKLPSSGQIAAVFPDVVNLGSGWVVKIPDLERLGYWRSDIRPGYLSEHSGQEGIHVLRERSQQWHLKKDNATIVMLGLDVDFGCERGPAGFVVGVLDGTGKLRARSDEITSYGDNLGASAEHAVTIDTGHYRISDDEQAFGVRLQHGDHDVRNCFDDEVLHLFRVVGDKVVRILTTDAGYQQVTEEDEEMKPDCYQWVYKGTFRMLPTKTLGFYEIERRMINGVRTVVYRWNGSGYEMVGPDPIDHTIRRRFDKCTGLPSCFSGHADCEHRPGYPWERVPKATDIKSAESPKNPDAQ